MLDFEKLDRLFEVTYDENKTGMYAYVWMKSKESESLEYTKHIKLSEAFSKVKAHSWHFYPGSENSLKTYLVTGLLNKELNAYETDAITLFLFSLGRNEPLENVNSTNGIKDTSLFQINGIRHEVNFMLGFCSENDFVKGFDYKNQKELNSKIEVLNLWKSKALNLLYKEFPSKFEEIKNNFLELL